MEETEMLLHIKVQRSPLSVGSYRGVEFEAAVQRAIKTIFRKKENNNTDIFSSGGHRFSQQQKRLRLPEAMFQKSSESVLETSCWRSSSLA